MKLGKQLDGSFSEREMGTSDFCSSMLSTIRDNIIEYPMIYDKPEFLMFFNLIFLNNENNMAQW